MLQSQFTHRCGDLIGLMGIQQVRATGGDVAEGASPGTDGAQDHEGGVFLLPTLPDVGAGRLLANRMQVEVPHQPSNLAGFR